MHEHEDGRVSGSIDRARVAELYAATDDDELRAHYREVLGDSDEGRALDEPTEDEAKDDEAAEDEADLDALREEYEAASGQKADGRWGEQRLRDEIAAYKDEGAEA
ncbi:MAG TPA: hypothetical protein VFB74_00005 [Kribbellaceae bacterium]|nr:hypothetical protein [Kribbellaceae bacterium]